MGFFASSLHKAFASEEFELAKAPVAFFSGIMFSALFVTLVLALFSSSARAYSSCTPSSSCDFAGQSCTQAFANNCYNSLSCECQTYSSILYWLEPSFKDCFCLSQLEISALYDGSGTQNDSSIGLTLSVSEDLKTFYNQRQQTVYGTQCNFDGGNAIACPPQHVDPPVDCRLFLAGPNLSNTLVATKTINADPGNVYSDSLVIPASFLNNSGSYAASLDCGVQLPQNSIECVSSCSAAFRQLSFGVQSCTPAISVSTDRQNYSNGDLIVVSGTLQNNNAPAAGTVSITVFDSSNNSIASTSVAAGVGGAYSASFSTAILGTGNYRVVANSSVGACPSVSATSFFSFFNCNVSLSASVPQYGVSEMPAAVSGSVSNNNSGVAAKVLVVTRSAGSEVDRQEVYSNPSGAFSLSLGPFLNGFYSTEFSAQYGICPAKVASGNFEVKCDVNVSAQANYDTFLSGDKIIVNGSVTRAGTPVSGNYTILIRDAPGNLVAQRQSSTASGFFSEQFESQNLSQGAYTIVVQASSGQCGTPQPSFQINVGCDVSASVAQLPNCFGNEAEFYVVRVDNLLATPNLIAINYSSPLQLVGPAFISLGAREGRVFNFSVNPAEDVVGNTVALVNVVGQNSNCPQKLQVPICIRGKISIEANPGKVLAIAGTMQCIPVTLRNRGPDSAIVSLSSVSISGSNFSPYFNTNKVKLSAYEIRDDLRLCADVPSGAIGLHQFTLRAQSALNDAQDDATFEVLDSQNKISTSFGGGCTAIDADSRIPLTVTNNLMPGDYWIEFVDNDGLGILASPSAILNFGTSSSRTLYLSFSPTQFNSSRNRYATMALKKDGKEVFTQALCFYTSSNASSVGSGTTVSSLSPQTITAACNSQGVSLLKVKNNAGATAAYSFSAATSAFTVSFSPQTLSLSPNAEATVSVLVTPKAGTIAGSYAIPITVQYSSNQSNEQARIECGDGNTVSITTCTGTSGVCSANCHYSGNAGNYAVSGSIRGVSCAQTQVAVGSVSSCVLSASPNSVSTGSSSTITVDYNNLGYNPSTVSINCGNGNTVTASGCTGTSGSCSATCQYPNSGVYSVSAGASGQSCASTQIAVGSVNAWCALVPSSKFVGGGGSTTISAYYQNLPTYYQFSSTASTYTNTETLYASVPSNCPVQNFGSSLTYVGGTPVPGSAGQQNASQQNASNAIIPLPVNLSIASSNHSYLIESGVLEAFAEFVVANPASASASIFATANVSGLPGDWNSSITPGNASIQPGANATFIARVSASNFEARDYNASFEVRDSQNRTASLPFKIKAGEATSLGSIISGFFVAGAGEANALMLAIVALLATGGFLVYKSSRNIEKARELEKQ